MFCLKPALFENMLFSKLDFLLHVFCKGIPALLFFLCMALSTNNLSDHGLSVIFNMCLAYNTSSELLTVSLALYSTTTKPTTCHCWRAHQILWHPSVTTDWLIEFVASYPIGYEGIWKMKVTLDKDSLMYFSLAVCGGPQICTQLFSLISVHWIIYLPIVLWICHTNVKVYKQMLINMNMLYMSGHTNVEFRNFCHVYTQLPILIDLKVVGQVTGTFFLILQKFFAVIVWYQEPMDINKSWVLTIVVKSLVLESISSSSHNELFPDFITTEQTTEPPATFDRQLSKSVYTVVTKRRVHLATSYAEWGLSTY